MQLNEVADYTSKLNLKNEIMSTDKTSIENESQPSCLGAVSRRLFLVTFLGKDERGEIVKGIEVMADSSEDAMNLIKEISMSREVYSAF